MKKEISTITITLLLLFIFLSGCINDNLDANHKSIQDAIDNAYDGDTIYVQSGTYYETLVVNKSITLIGAGKDITIIDCKEVSKADHVDIVLITADNCTISGFKITNTDVSSDVIGIHIKSSNNTISDNTISYTSQGVEITGDSKNNNVSLNNIINNQYGIVLRLSDNNNISKNDLSLNSISGISVESASHSNIISSNTFSDNKNGIQIPDGKSNNIFKNTFIDNQKGIYFCCSSGDNIVYYNTFKQNSECNARDITSNQWDIDSVGNYWDDFDEPSEGAYDNNDDGIVDASYNISGGTNQDRYPLINPP
jgi:nitrous oxidase accessory protein